MTHDEIMATASHYSEVDAQGYVRFCEDDLINFADALLAPSSAATVSDAASVLSNEQIIERCKAAGIKWIPPELPDDCDYEMGFPGSFDMVTMDEMRALLTAASDQASGQAVPKGWKLVPIVPTRGMPVAGGLVPRGEHLFHHPGGGDERIEVIGFGKACEVWAAMLAAAPSPAVREAGDGVTLTDSDILVLWDQTMAPDDDENREHKLIVRFARALLKEAK